MVSRLPNVLNRSGGKAIPTHYFYLLGALFFFFFYLAIWPLLWHLAILPQARLDKHQLRVESYSPNRVVGTSLFLDKPNSSLFAYAVWQVPKEGFYHFKLSCDDNGKVLIDNRSIITLRGISPLNVEETKQWLNSGPHFLELHLNNIIGKGWLTIEVAGPGQTDYSPLSIDELSYPDIGNIKTLLDIVFCGKIFCLLGFLGFGLLGLRFYFNQYAMFSSKQEAAKANVPEKPIPSYFILWASLFFFLFHFAIWPLVWHWAILPQAQPDKHQLRVESYSPNRVVGTSLFLDKPDSSLSAYAVWQIPKGGLYQLKLSCGGNGKVLIDSRPIITMKGIRSFKVWEAKTWLAPGLHFLELRLKNNLEKGWLRVEVAKPGQAYYESLNANELSFLELENIGTWLELVSWGEYLCFLAFLGLGLLWLGLFYFRRWAGKIFPDRSWEIFFGGLTLFALALSIIYYTKHPLPPIYGDGIGYYSYLPSYLIYHDLSMESLYQPIYLYDYHGWDVFMRYPASGYYVGKSIGTAVLMLPFFLLGYLVAPLLGSAPDGFSIVYQFAIVLAAVFYMLVGLVLLFNILIRYFPSRVVMVTLLSLFLGTNFLAYATTAVSLNHIYSFFLVCLFLFLIPRWYADPSRSNTLFLGIVAGMITLVRNNNVSLLLFLPLYGIISRDTLRERANFLWQARNKIFLMLGIATLVFSPQIITLRIAANQFIVSPYNRPGEKFYFLSPQIFKVLFSPYHGLFIWSPILLFSVFGLFRMKGLLKFYRLPIVVCLMLQLYIVSSWYDWPLGWGFGYRAFVDTMGMFALPLACFYGNLNKAITKKFLIFVSTFFIVYTFYCFIQFFQGVLPGETHTHMNWPQYKTTLLNPDGFIELWQWLKNPTVNNYRLSR